MGEAAQALGSWRSDPGILAAAFLVAVLYWRGWARLHREQPDRYPTARLFSFLSGLLLVAVAILSPLDAFANLLLQVHMLQHLLLLMAAPPLLWLGQPVPALARSLPPAVVRAVFTPFLKSPAMRACGSFLTHPVFTWLLFQVVLIGWHVPFFYELSLQDSGWHEVEHLSFLTAALLFWWPVVPAWPGRPRWPRAAFILYLLAADLVNTAMSAFFAFSGTAVYPSYRDGPRLWGISAADDQVAAGVIMWVPGSIAYLIPAFAIAVRFISGTRRLPPPSRPVRSLAALPRRTPLRHAPFDLLRVPGAGWLLRQPLFRRMLQAATLLAAAMVMWDGWFGPPIAALNLGGLLPWIEWRGLLVIVLLVAGNFFCMACPFMLPREWAKRLFGGTRRWPAALRSKWLAAGLLAAYLIAYEAFSLWNRPAWTASIVAGYFVAAFTLDAFFKGASFCKYVCPIGQFNFTQSLFSPLEVKVREAAVCQSCRTYDCIRGNPRQRGCELALFQPKKAGNLDCTFCLDCVYACPQQNVGLLAAVPGGTLLDAAPRSSIGRLFRRWDWTALAFALTFGAFANAAAMTPPVAAFLANGQGNAGVFSRLPAVAAFYAVCFAAAALAMAACVWLSRGPHTFPLRERAIRFSLSLLPLGAAMWLGHSLFHLLTARGAGAALERFLAEHQLPGLAALVVPFGLPRLTPDEILSSQLVLLGLGWVGSAVLIWLHARAPGRPSAAAARTAAPWWAASAMLYLAGVWIFLQPMEMRGTDRSLLSSVRLPATPLIFDPRRAGCL